MAEQITEEYEEPIPSIVDRLASLRDDWSGDIPKDIVYTDTYKVRKNWFTMVFLNFQEAIRDQLVSPGLRQEMTDFMSSRTGPDFSQKPTSAGDIEQTDILINKTIAEIQSKGER